MAFTGQAAPVTLSKLELALLDSVDDPSVSHGRFVAESDDPVAPPVAWDTRVARTAMITVLLLAGMLPVALVLAIAVR